MRRSVATKHDQAHMLAIADALIVAGNPPMHSPPWRSWLTTYCELTKPIDFELVSRLTADDPFVSTDSERDQIVCAHCEHSIVGYVSALEYAAFLRLIDRGVESVGGTLPDSCSHLDAVFEELVKGGNYTTSEPTFRRIGVVLQSEVGDSIDCDLVRSVLPQWSRVIVSEPDDEVYCRDCKASIVGPRFPWDRPPPSLTPDYSKLTRVVPEQNTKLPREH